MTPFTYPAGPLTRRHGPAGYLDYESFRPWLRDEFAFRCVYCLRRERWEPDLGVFEIDHFAPLSKSPELRLTYRNLLYSCTTCNAAKQDQVLPDPAVAFTAGNVKVEADGSLSGRTREVRLLIRLLDLNDPMYVTWRSRLIRIVALSAKHDRALFRDLLAYPDDLPDLSRLQPPEGNTCPEGIADSHFERRNRGELPDMYRPGHSAPGQAERQAEGCQAPRGKQAVRGRKGSDPASGGRKGEGRKGADPE